MHDVQNQHHIVLRDTVKDDLIASGEAAHTRTQIATPSSHVWIPGQQPKALVDALHHPCGKIDAAAIAGHVNPDAVKLGFRLGRKTELAHRRRFCSAESRAMPRRLMSSVSCVTSSWVVILRPSPRAKDASACSTAASISNRRRSRSSQRDMASCTASSLRCNRPVSMAWRINASWPGGKCNSIRLYRNSSYPNSQLPDDTPHRRLYPGRLVHPGGVLGMRKSVLSLGAGGLLLAGLLAAADTKGDSAKGKEVFEQCGVCHNTDTDEKK